jgi:hypothetical protein
VVAHGHFDHSTAKTEILLFYNNFNFQCPNLRPRGSRERVTGPNTLGVVFYTLGILLLSFAICTGPFCRAKTAPTLTQLIKEVLG